LRFSYFNFNAIKAKHKVTVEVNKKKNFKDIQLEASITTSSTIVSFAFTLFLRCISQPFKNQNFPSKNVFFYEKFFPIDN
jgi:hypothetical protein